MSYVLILKENGVLTPLIAIDKDKFDKLSWKVKAFTEYTELPDGHPDKGTDMELTRLKEMHDDYMDLQFDMPDENQRFRKKKVKQ